MYPVPRDPLPGPGAYRPRSPELQPTRLWAFAIPKADLIILKNKGEKLIIDWSDKE